MFPVLKHPCHGRIQVRLFCFIFSVSSEKIQALDALSLLCHNVIHDFVLNDLTSLSWLYPIHSNWQSDLSALCTDTEVVTKRKCCMRVFCWFEQNGYRHSMVSLMLQTEKNQCFPTVADYLLLGPLQLWGSTEVTLFFYTYLTY